MNSSTPETTSPVRWVTVFEGSQGAALAAQASLGSAGFLTYLPDYQLKILDPFLTGANALTVRVQVPSDVAAEAARLIAPDANFVPERDEGAPGDATARLRALGWRVCFASLALVTAPIAVYWSVRYFAETKRLGLRPENHRWVVAATVLSLAACAVAVAALAANVASLPRLP